MKNLIIVLVLALFIGNKVRAQQKGKTHNLMVTIRSGNSSHSQMIVTKEDGTQEITKAAKNSWIWTGTTFEGSDGKFASNEDSLFLTLKRFFDAGWKLVASNVMMKPDEDYISRYFFTKED